MTRKRSSDVTSADVQTSNLVNTTEVIQVSQKKFHCLVCYKLIDDFTDRVKSMEQVENVLDNNGDREKAKKRMKICLRFYSQVSTWGERRKNEKWKSLHRNCGVCHDCFSVIDSHCMIYQEIEYLKLKLRWQLDKIQMVMKYAGKVPSRVKAFKESFGKGQRVSGDEIKSSLEYHRVENLENVMEFRNKMFDACSKKLKIKNPKVVLTPLANIVSKQAHQQTIPSFARETIPEGNNDTAHLPHQSKLQEPDPEDSEDRSTFNHHDDNSNEEIMYIVKTEGEKGDEDFRKFVTPPESILNALQNGNLPMEGVSKNHYFYCTPATPPNCGDDSDTDVEDSPCTPNAYTLNSEKESTKDVEENPLGIYKCIKCADTFSSKDTLIRHARVGNCFANENIDLTLSPPRLLLTGRSNESSPVKRRRKRSSNDNFNEKYFKKLKESPVKAATVLNFDKGDSKNDDSSSQNVVASAIDKILSGLRSTYFKCPNCSETFASEPNFKSHLVSRVCFREIKRRSTSGKFQKGRRNKNLSENDDDDENNSDLSSLSTSSHEEDTDSDYTETKSAMAKNKSNNKKRPGRKRKAKVVAKRSCPVENCEKFFLYEEDFDRHMKQKHNDQFSCQWCTFITDHANKIANHEIKNHSKKFNGHVICPRCPSTSALSSDKEKQTEHYIKRHLSTGNKK